MKTNIGLDLPLRCKCGHVRGVAVDVSPSTGFRFVCYCGDCQAFARFLRRTDVLDAAGGTDIFQFVGWVERPRPPKLNERRWKRNPS